MTDPDTDVPQPDQSSSAAPSPTNQWLLTITAEAEVIPGEPKEDQQ